MMRGAGMLPMMINGARAHLLSFANRTHLGQSHQRSLRVETPLLLGIDPLIRERRCSGPSGGCTLAAAALQLRLLVRWGVPALSAGMPRLAMRAAPSPDGA